MVLGSLGLVLDVPSGLWVPRFGTLVPRFDPCVPRFVPWIPKFGPWVPRFAQCVGTGRPSYGPQIKLRTTTGFYDVSYLG